MKTNVECITFLNPRTCGIYKSGGTRYKTDPNTGKRTKAIDNELLDQVEAHLRGEELPSASSVPVSDVFECRVLVPTYHDRRFNGGIERFLDSNSLKGVTIGELIDCEYVRELRGHGSPSNDQRTGQIPYIKVSDIRGLRINVNPTNLVTKAVAERFWNGEDSGLEKWDLVTPNRASNNIGEFAILLPGEESVVLTKEVFVFRVTRNYLFDQFYLLWALSLTVVREQWRRIALMQTNREDCGNRYREIIIPKPPHLIWARQASEAFRTYLESIGGAKQSFAAKLKCDPFEYVANVFPSSTS